MSVEQEYLASREKGYLSPVTSPWWAKGADGGGVEHCVTSVFARPLGDVGWLGEATPPGV